MRGVDKAVKGAVLCATLLAVSSAAIAAAGVVKTDVTVLSDRVTYSTVGNPAFTGFVGYSFLVSNTSGNTINKVTWVATLKVATSTEEIAFSSADGIDISKCSFSSAPPLQEANELTITCQFGQMRGNEKRSFSLFFKSPVADFPVTNDNVAISGKTITAEGSNGGNSENNSIDYWPADAVGNPLPPITVELGTISPVRIKSAVPKSGATFFTGIGVPAGVDDPIATTVTVPAAVPDVTYPNSAEVLEEPAGAGCLNNFTTCYSTTLHIEGTFSPYLMITLRVDASVVKKGVKIDSIGIKYTADDATVWNITKDDRCINGLPYPVGHARYGVPCILSSQVYKQSYKPNPALSGDYEWILLNSNNGRLEFF